MEQEISNTNQSDNRLMKPKATTTPSVKTLTGTRFVKSIEQIKLTLSLKSGSVLLSKRNNNCGHARHRATNSCHQT